mgnify:CR=1 FL=1
MSSSVQFYLAILFSHDLCGHYVRENTSYDCALAGGGAMIYFGLVTQEQAITEFIDFNTLGLLTGMMILISVVKQSGFFQVLALWALKKSKGSPRELLILLSIVTAVGRRVIDSVTAALLIAPMTISLCRMLRMSPVPI